MTKNLFEIGEISSDSIFIDGTKIEVNANKYTFVWKKATTKNLAKLLDKLAVFVAECEELYGLKIVYQNKVKLKHLKKLQKNVCIKRTGRNCFCTWYRQTKKSFAEKY